MKEINVEGYGELTVRIANMITPSECLQEDFSQTACGFVVEFVDIITEHNMNSSLSNTGGWPASDMYSFVNNNIYNALPKDLKNVIIDTYAISGHRNNETTNFESIDKLFLLSTKEVWGEFNYIYDTSMDNTRQLDYYKNKNVTVDNYSGAKKNSNHWWLRSATSTDGQYFYLVSSDGAEYDISANNAYGVSPAFRIG